MAEHDAHRAFQQHFDAALAHRGADYATYEPFYQFGAERARAADGARPYDEVADRLRATYATRYPDSDYDHVEEAVRYGYEHTRGSTS